MSAGWIALFAITILTVLAAFSTRRGHVASAVLTSDAIVVTALGLNRLWALRHKVVVPLVAITRVELSVSQSQAPRGLRWPGAHIPGVMTMGTYRRSGRAFFWLAGREPNICVIETTGMPYNALVLELDDAGRAAVAASRGVGGVAK